MTNVLHRLVAKVAVVGLLALMVTFALVHGSEALGPLPTAGWLSWAHGWQLIGVCLVLTMLGDAVAVRVRHGEETEELTLFEAACVVDVLVLPGHWALVVPVVATVLVSTLRRRGLIKVLFNGGNLAVAVSVLVGSAHLIDSPGVGPPDARTVLALTVGMLGLTVVNLVALSRVLAIVGDDNPREVVRDGLRLSLVMAIGAVALGASAVTLAAAAPALVPFALMPAAALTFAFRAAAQESEERARSVVLLRLSQVLAGGLGAPEMLASFLDLARQAFGVDVATAVVEQDAPEPVAVTAGHQGLPTARAATSEERELLERSAQYGAHVLRDDLPPAWRSALAIPLESQGRQYGVLLIAHTTKHRSLGARELTLLSSLTSALCVALRGAEDLRRLVDERHKLKTVVDQSSDGILVLDGRGNIQLWSPAMTRLTGTSEDAALGQPWGQIMRSATPAGDDVDPFLAACALSPTEPRTNAELHVQRGDGEVRVVGCAHAGVFGEAGELVRDVVIVRDVTRERQVERMKADFIATVSHELRTPVTPIKGYADLLRRRGHAMTEEKRASCLEIISDRAAHLSQLVEDLLLASRISESGGQARVTMTEEDLGALVRRAAGDFGADSARIALEIPPTPVSVRCDAMRTIQVLSNLFGNAVKYSDAGSQVSVRLRTDGAQALLEVSDCGRGIPADQLEQIFDKFHRVEDPLLMTTGGTGLGLYIARRLTTAMGGRLTCASTLNVGSVFTLTLSLTGSPAPLPAAFATVSGVAAGPTPLLPTPRPEVLDSLADWSGTF